MKAIKETCLTPRETVDFRPFAFGDLLVRVTIKDNQEWFVAKDIASALCYESSRTMTRRLDDDEKAGVQILHASSSGVRQNRNTIIINESGLYNAILGSNKPEAKLFKKWVTSEVLPQIRKTGMFGRDPEDVELIGTAASVIRRLTSEKTALARENRLYRENEKLRERLEKTGKPLTEKEKAFVDSCARAGIPTKSIAERLNRRSDSAIRAYIKKRALV